MFDAAVCVVGCDKTIPAAAMALARMNLPGLVLYGGTIAPGKYRYIATDQWSGRDEWIRRLLGQVEVFGVGNVAPGFVAGVEMAQPSSSITKSSGAMLRTASRIASSTSPSAVVPSPMDV